MERQPELNRRRTSLAFLAAALFAAPAYAQKPLVWASDAEGGAPYIFKDPQNPGQNIGFEVDLIAALARELGRPITFKQYEFKNLFSGLERNDFDFAMDGLEVTPDRKQKVRFSRPYYVYTQQLVARATEKRFRTLDECRQQDGIVGTMEETAAERILDQQGVRKQIYDGPVEAYRDLELGRLDAVLLDLPIAVYYAQPRPSLRCLGEPLGKGYYAVAFRKTDEALAAEFDAALERLLTSGELRRIYEKWNLWNGDQNELTVATVGDILGESSKRWTFGVYFPLLLEAAGVTVRISVFGMLLAVALGLPIALTRLYGSAPMRLLATLYVEFFRGIPVLLLLYFLYYGLPSIAEYYQLGWSLRLDPIEAAVLGFGLNYAAYEAEIYRAGIASIPAGQWEAAASLGMSRPLTFRRIILPQAVRVILPPMTNDFVALFKDTSVVSVIAAVELSKQYQILAKSSLKFLEIGLTTAALYLVMSVPLGYLSRYLEARWARHI